ncbi:hypothetical protein CBR_g17670 [Chara braunii]|uniref:isoleucine--tRNA ligase n=1 Tax=Chara braunii TaxID=69332 RepID=A0A388KVD4_CHABU|nr:hypothetical protein CBR_g17670 [Chara braunii]|eukprot:GBG73958.1 hypothetical protein CBR_g17670 [Chara braunii]
MCIDLLAMSIELKGGRTQLKRTEGKPEYVFYDGPPFATGLPHYGHILAGTIKDIVTRYQTTTGHHVTRRFGWDCHGLPVEYEIDQKLNIKTRDDVLQMGIDKYNEECRSIVMRYSKEWETIITRMGRWIDFKNDYKTLDPSFMESIWWVFKQLYEKGLVYRGFKVMPYSTGCNTALSNFEAGLNYKDVSDPAIVVSFPVVGDADGAALLAWTTTPWTLPSNLALCVNANFTYLKVKEKHTGAVYIIAESRVSQLPARKKLKSGTGTENGPASTGLGPHEPSANGKKSGKKGSAAGKKAGAAGGKNAAEQNATGGTSGLDSEAYDLLGKIKGSDLVGKRYLPIFDYFAELSEAAFRVLADNYVTDDSGTGIVHQAPAFGEDDHRVCLRENVIQKGEDLPNPVDLNGRFTEKVKDFAGKYVKDADKEIIAHLKAKQRLVSSGSVVHPYPFCWRSETPLIYKAVPSWYEKRFHNWLENARDWAISRSRFWGTPLPIWMSEDGKEIVAVGSVEELERLSGFRATDLHRHKIDHVTIPSSRGPEFGVLRRVEEVFDCWFESGSMPYGYIHYPFENRELFENNFPGDFVAEGLDQTRGWFYTLMVLSTALFDKPAFKNLICNGLVLAEDGKKMSKRLKNYPPPTDVVNEFGADALRLYLINSPVVRAETLRFKKDGVFAVVKDVFLPWYNAYRFLVQNALRLQAEGSSPFKPFEMSVVQTSVNVLDRWINSSSQSLVQFVRAEMEAYRLFTVVPFLLDFIEKLTNIYVRLNRKRLKGRTGEDDCRMALSALYHVLLTLCKTMAPFTPFFTECMYQNLSRVLADGAEESVHYCSFPEPQKPADPRIERSVRRMQTVVDLARTIRERHNRPLKTPLNTLFSNYCEGACGTGGQFGLPWSDQYVLEEMNVRSIVPCSDLLKYANLRAQPEYSILGERLGRSMGEVAKRVKSMSLAEILEYEKTGFFDAAGHRLGAGDIKVIRDFKLPADIAVGELDAASDGDALVVLDLRSDGSLADAGTAREIVNRIQKLRKKAGLEPSDVVEVFYEILDASEDSDPTALKRVVVSQEEYIADALGSPFMPFTVCPADEVIIADQLFKGVAGGSFKIILTRPSPAFDDKAMLKACGGNAEHAIRLQTWILSRDLTTLRVELSNNKGKVHVNIDGQPPYDVKVDREFFLSTGDKYRATKI